MVLVKGLALGALEVLVEPTLAGVRERAAEDGVQLAETARGLDVADDADDDHRRGLDDGDRLDNLLLVGL